jgi:2-aminoethylphosphonate-pyruvate transaminase
VSSSNKCIEGVPGFAFVIAEKQALAKCQGNARSLALDLFAQWRGLETSGQFRFTPPVQVVAAFDQALAEWQAEGGWQGRGQRYRRNYETICEGLTNLGFTFYVEDPEIRGHIITTFMEPTQTENWNFQKFYDLLAAEGFVIYPGKLAEGASFRLGSIGNISPDDCRRLVAAIVKSLASMGVAVPVKY